MVDNQKLSTILFYTTSVLMLWPEVLHQTSARHVSSMFHGLDSHPNWDLLPLDHCGQGGSVPKIDIKVFGGKNASLGQFPWMANFFKTHERQLKNEHDCGGSIINSRYILSAAHCCDSVSPEKAWVRVGEYNLDHDGEECTPKGCVDPVQNIPVESITMHENFSSSIWHDDICLIRLRHPIIFNEYVHPICLPVYESLQNRSFVGDTMEVAGWGRSDKYWNAQTPILQTTELPVVSEQDCKKDYPEIESKELCAGGRTSGTRWNRQGICIGDSGGPLMKQVEVTGTKRYFIFGIASYVRVSGFPGFWFCDIEVPGVFTRVTSYLGWILDNLKP